MSSAPETQETQTQDEVSQLEAPITETPADSTFQESESHPSADGEQTKKKRERKEPAPLEHEPGKSILPFSRVQKIIKADKEIPLVAKEATFLISLATEEFIKRISEASQRVAKRDNRTTVQYRDVATVVRKTDEFLFLEEITPWISVDAPAKRTKTSEQVDKGPLDQFVRKDEAETPDAGEDDIGEGMVEDGTEEASQGVD